MTHRPVRATLLSILSPNPKGLAMLSLSRSRNLKALLTCAVLTFASLSHAQQVLRVTTIPEEAATEQVR